MAEVGLPWVPSVYRPSGDVEWWEQVLVKMLNSGLFCELNGCVSTGKEANVYQACTADGDDLAVKIYKTSILTFKDRDRSAHFCRLAQISFQRSGTACPVCFQKEEKSAIVQYFLSQSRCVSVYMPICLLKEASSHG